MANLALVDNRTVKYCQYGLRFTDFLSLAAFSQLNNVLIQHNQICDLASLYATKNILMTK